MPKESACLTRLGSCILGNRRNKHESLEQALPVHFSYVHLSLQLLSGHGFQYLFVLH